MDNSSFIPEQFYQSYPSTLISRPGYPARAQYKSTLMWDVWGDQIMNILNHNIQNYADIGGCFGFGANSLAYQIFRSQGSYPKTKVFELVPEFLKMGEQLFPHIEFIGEDFLFYSGEPDRFDIISLFDIVEHIPNPEFFLSMVAKKTKLALIKTPMETGGDLFGSKPPEKQGFEHEDGHINFFSPSKYIKLLNNSGFDIIKGKFVKSIVPREANRILLPELTLEKGLLKRVLMFGFNCTPYTITRKLIGSGEHICLAKSRYYMD